MKLRSLLPMAAFAALVLTGCSKDDVVAPNLEPTVTEGYATFKINLPSTPGSRAEDVAGDASEYKINDVTLLIFVDENKSGIANAKFYRKILAGNGAPWEDGSGQITASGNVTANIGKISDANDYYVVAVMNSTGVTLPTNNQLYNDWIATAQSDYLMSTENGFYMSNAALSDGTNVNSLVKINQAAIASTPSEATKAAATIYVERAAVKVAVNPVSEDWTYAPTSKTSDEVTITNWTLDNTNKQGFPVMNPVNGLAYSGKYVAATEVASGLKRITWCQDKNYDNSNLTFNTSFDTWYDLANCGYCLENTMDVSNQKKDRATRVVFKATYKLSGEGAQTLIQLKNSATIYTKETFKTLVQAKTDAIISGYNVTVNDIEGGVKKLSDIVTIKNGETSLDAAIFASVAAAIGITDDSTASISYYKDGVTYYAAYIRHFNDDEIGADNVGKYGVVRNNWYELTVKSISAIGEPARPDTQDPDNPSDPGDIDVEKSYINVSINILKWAKRTQNVDL